MKRILFLLATVSFLGMSIAVQAQNFRVNTGLDFAVPLGDFAEAHTFGYGLSLGGEYPVGDKTGLTASVGFIIFAIDNDAEYLLKSYVVPYQLGVKHYFREQQLGSYVHVQVGTQRLSMIYEDTGSSFLPTFGGNKESSTNFNCAIGAGYFLTEKFDICLRYNLTTSDNNVPQAYSYIALKTAYTF